MGTQQQQQTGSSQNSTTRNQTAAPAVASSSSNSEAAAAAGFDDRIPWPVVGGMRQLTGFQLTDVDALEADVTVALEELSDGQPRLAIHEEIPSISALTRQENPFLMGTPASDEIHPASRLADHMPKVYAEIVASLSGSPAVRATGEAPPFRVTLPGGEIRGSILLDITHKRGMNSPVSAGGVDTVSGGSAEETTDTVGGGLALGKAPVVGTLTGSRAAKTGTSSGYSRATSMTATGLPGRNCVGDVLATVVLIFTPDDQFDPPGHANVAQAQAIVGIALWDELRLEEWH
jgi:hypothetical protein